jgi:dephospho-CoA kinase
MRKFLVGLTGGIGSGKSAAAEYFEKLGITCVDADIASRAVVEPGQPALQAIAAHFGADILAPDGALDRARLRHLVFADAGERSWLQSLLHPLISSWLREQIDEAESAYVVLVNPLLIESGQNTWCDRILVIDVPEELQVSRTMARDDNTEQQVINIIKAQAARSQRLSMADDVIVNDQDLPHLQAKVEDLHRKYLELCQTQHA